MNKDYFIGDNITMIGNKNDLKSGVRIFCIKYTWLRVELGGGFEGPYSSLAELKAGSEIFKKTNKEDSKRIQKILRPENIITCNINDSIFAPSEVGHRYDLMKSIHHIISGDVGKNKHLSGVHLFDEAQMRIVKITREPDNMGVWEAMIEVWDNKLQKHIGKPNPSTFFPSNWSRTRLFDEIIVAYNNRYKCPECMNIWHGKTKCGIFVDMYINNGIIKTIYPRHQHENE
ncbi:EndoU domain-containing protein [Dysgonomonas sp. OttesenSCG-928-D17]|nr:EndoU domain-containing protein [Dysgonomonas sp. OttesenSCG-928-D17]